MPQQFRPEHETVLQESHYTSVLGTGWADFMPLVPYELLVDAVIIATDDVVDHKVRLGWDDAGTVSMLGSATLLAGAGTGGAKSLDLLAEALPLSFGSFPLPPNVSLAIAVEVALTATKTLHVTTVAGKV